MTLIVPNTSEVIIMQNFLNVAVPQDLVLKLYSSNTTLDEDTSSGDLTELTGGGYSDVTLTAGNWTVVGGGPTVATYPEIIFNFTGVAGNTYGYYVVQSVSGALLWVEEFAGAPLNVQNNGDEIRVTLRITLE
jgi:hypothetical protein